MGVDLITVSGLRAHGHHGVLERERTHGQEFVVDVALEVAVDSERVGDDDLSGTVDYSVIARTVVRRIGGPALRLIENLAQLIADDCLAHDRVEAVTVTVHKPGAPVPERFSDICVTIRRPIDRATASP